MFLWKPQIDVPSNVDLSFVRGPEGYQDSLQKIEVCFPMKGLVVIVKESGNSIEVYKELSGLVIVFHDQLFEFNFCVGDLVVWIEVNHEFFYEFIIVVKPGGFLIRVIRQVGLEVIESCSFQERQSVGDFVRVGPE